MNLWGLLVIFFMSMVPIIELRGAIPIGIVTFGFEPYIVYTVCVLGNILPVPFLILFSKKILDYMRTVRHVGPFFAKYLDRAHANAGKITSFQLLGVFLFVAVPLPLTGAWTGSVIAAILGLRVKKAFFAVAAGVLSSGLIMWGLSAAGIFLFS